MKHNKTPQDITNQSQLPNNSSPVTGVVDSCIKTLKQILTPEEQQACEDSNNHFELLLIQFRDQVKTISNKIGYHYGINSYEMKLGIFDDIKDEELKILFEGNPNLEKIFNEIIEKSNFSQDITRDILMKEGLEDLILENMGQIDEKPKKINVTPEDVEDFMKDNPEIIRRIIKGGRYTKLDFYKLYEIFQNNPKAFISFIKTAGESGIKSLNLKGDNLNKIFSNNPKAFESFIKTAGESGIKSLDLSGNNLNQIFQNNPKAFISFIKTAGESGIRGLNLGDNDLDLIFQNNLEAFESFIKTAGESGIKSLNLKDNNLNKIFSNDPKYLFDLLNIINQGCVKYWDLTGNRIEILLSLKSTKKQFESKNKELKKKGIIVFYCI